MKKLFWHFPFLLLFILGNCKKDNTFITSALSQIINGFFINQSVKFDVIVYGEETQKLDDIVNKLMKVSETPVKLVKVNFRKRKVLIKQSAILLFDNVQSYRDFHSRAYLRSQEDFHGFQFFVFIDNFVENRLTNLGFSTEEALKPHRLFRSLNFLMQKTSDKEMMDLITFVTFKTKKCRNWKKMAVNRFSKRTRKWTSGKFFLEKFNNFNGCLLIVLVPIPQPLMFTVFQDEKENFQFLGYGTKIHDIISNNLNYTFFLNPRLGFDNGNNTLIEDFLFSSMPMRQGYVVNAKVITTERITTKDVIILTSRSPPYEQFDKIFLPFDIEVWHWLIATFVIAVFVIFIVKLTSRKIQNFMFGSKVQTPILNLM